MPFLETSRAAELGPITWDAVVPGLLSVAGLVVMLGTFTALGLAGLGLPHSGRGA